MSLNKCLGLWGESHLMYGDPPWCSLQDALFVPFLENTRGSWGLYDSNRLLVKEGQDRRGRALTPHYANAWAETEVAEDHTRDCYIYCGFLNPHFGHFIINSLPKFWPYFSGKFGRRKILISQPADRLPDFMKTIFARLDIKVSDFAYFDQPTRVNDIIVPESAILEQYYIYTIFKDLCSKIALPWLEAIDTEPVPAYISKSRLKVGVGRFVDEKVIEQIMLQSGLDIFYPETMSIVEQVRLFASRRLCVGPIGSAFHSTIFAPEGQNIVCYSPITHINSNFDLIDKLNRNNAHYFYQEGATFEHNSGGFLTSVSLADPRQLAFDFLDEIEQCTAWRRRPGA